MKKIVLLALAISAFTVFQTKAQLVIKNDGRVIVGRERYTDDMYQILSMSIQGKYGEYNAGAKLGFGDFGRFENNGWNVFIGEYGDWDSDALWLHGKKGFVMTAFNSTYRVCEWNYNDWSQPRFTIYDGVRADRISISSDDNHKNNISNIYNALPRLLMLNGITYNYQQIENECPVGYVGEISRTIDSSAKGLSEHNLTASIEQIRQRGDTRYGLITSEILNQFPEIVEYDQYGNQYVNYLELIPVMVSAIKDLYTVIIYHGLDLNVMEDYQNHLQNTGHDSTTNNQQRSFRSIQPTFPDTTQSVLYQNSPNPFSNTTTIEYYIPRYATNATLFIFNLSGELLQTHPLNTSGTGQVTISGSTLNAGMYIYTLVVNNQVVDTKRMILTK